MECIRIQTVLKEAAYFKREIYYWEWKQCDGGPINDILPPLKFKLQIIHFTRLGSDFHNIIAVYTDNTNTIIKFSKKKKKTSMLLKLKIPNIVNRTRANGIVVTRKQVQIRIVSDQA